MLSATSTSSMETLTVGGSGAGSFALGGSVSLNKIRDNTEAYITNGSNVVAAGAVEILVTDRPTIEALAGGVAGAGAASIGEALATNNINNTDSAYVNAATITAQGIVTVSASSTSSLETLTVGGAGAGSFALGGSVSLNTIVNTVSADIVNCSTVTAVGAIDVSMSDSPTIKALSGGVAGAGAAAIGAAPATNNISDTDTAYINDSDATSSAGSVTVSATSTSLMETLTVGGAAWCIRLGRFGVVEQYRE